MCRSCPLGNTDVLDVQKGTERCAKMALNKRGGKQTIKKKKNKKMVQISFSKAERAQRK